MEQCKIQTPGNHPKERIQHSEHGESLRSRIIEFIYSYAGSIVVVFRPVYVAAKSAHKLRHIRPSPRIGGTPTGRISMKFDIGCFYEISSRKKKLSKSAATCSARIQGRHCCVSTAIVVMRMPHNITSYLER